MLRHHRGIEIPEHSAITGLKGHPGTGMERELMNMQVAEFRQVYGKVFQVITLTKTLRQNIYLKHNMEIQKICLK